MSTLDKSNWTPLGRTSNAEYFEVEPGLLVGVTDDRDSAATAKENVGFYREYFRDAPGVVVMVLHDTPQQDKGARDVYKSELESNLILGINLVVRTLLARALASIFIGLSRPPVVMKTSSSFEEAAAWARTLLAERK